MERQRRLQQEAAAALHGALVYLNRDLCKEPLSLGMFARPNLKALQAVMYLLHQRIRGAARTKRVRGGRAGAGFMLVVRLECGWHWFYVVGRH
jgi:hypothetical protein